MSENSQMQSEWEKKTVRLRRRRKILAFYDQHHFNYVLDDDDELDMAQLERAIDLVDIEQDYRSVIRMIQNDEQSRIEREEAADQRLQHQQHRHSSRPTHQSSMTVLTAPSSQTLNSRIFAAKRQSQTMGGAHGGGRMRSKSAAHVMHSNILYHVDAAEQLAEKDWMRQL